MAQRNRQSSRQGGQQRSRGGGRSGGRAGRKSREEARVERLTWLAMAGVFILLSMFDPDNQIPDYIVAFVISGILIISGIYQFMQTSWRVSPFVWMVSGILGFFGVFAILSETNGWYRVPVDLRLISLGVVVFVILLGIITNEA